MAKFELKSHNPYEYFEAIAELLANSNRNGQITTNDAIRSAICSKISCLKQRLDEINKKLTDFGSVEIRLLTDSLCKLGLEDEKSEIQTKITEMAHVLDTVFRNKDTKCKYDSVVFRGGAADEAYAAVISFITLKGEENVGSSELMSDGEVIDDSVVHDISINSYHCDEPETMMTNSDDNDDTSEKELSYQKIPRCSYPCDGNPMNHTTWFCKLSSSFWKFEENVKCETCIRILTRKIKISQARCLECSRHIRSYRKSPTKQDISRTYDDGVTVNNLVIEHDRSTEESSKTPAPSTKPEELDMMDELCDEIVIDPPPTTPPQPTQYFPNHYTQNIFENSPSAKFCTPSNTTHLEFQIPSTPDTQSREPNNDVPVDEVLVIKGNETLAPIIHAPATARNNSSDSLQTLITHQSELQCHVCTTQPSSPQLSPPSSQIESTSSNHPYSTSAITDTAGDSTSIEEVQTNKIPFSIDEMPSPAEQITTIQRDIQIEDLSTPPSPSSPPHQNTKNYCKENSILNTEHKESVVVDTLTQTVTQRLRVNAQSKISSSMPANLEAMWPVVNSSFQTQQYKEMNNKNADNKELLAKSVAETEPCHVGEIQDAVICIESSFSVSPSSNCTSILNEVSLPGQKQQRRQAEEMMNGSGSDTSQISHIVPTPKRESSRRIGNKINQKILKVLFPPNTNNVSDERSDAIDFTPTSYLRPNMQTSSTDLINQKPKYGRPKKERPGKPGRPCKYRKVQTGKINDVLAGNMLQNKQHSPMTQKPKRGRPCKIKPMIMQIEEPSDNVLEQYIQSQLSNTEFRDEGEEQMEINEPRPSSSTSIAPTCEIPKSPKQSCTKYINYKDKSKEKPKATLQDPGKHKLDNRYTLARRLPPNSIRNFPALSTSKNKKPVKKVWCCNRWQSKEVYRDHELSATHLKKVNFSRRKTLRRLVAKLRILKTERYCQVCNIVFARANTYSAHVKRAMKRGGSCNANRKKKENLLQLAEELQLRFETEMRYNNKAKKLVHRAIKFNNTKRYRIPSTNATPSEINQLA